jgi:hypothetical protein
VISPLTAVKQTPHFFGRTTFRKDVFVRALEKGKKLTANESKEEPMQFQANAQANCHFCMVSLAISFSFWPLPTRLHFGISFVHIDRMG